MSSRRPINPDPAFVDCPLPSENSMVVDFWLHGFLSDVDSSRVDPVEGCWDNLADYDDDSSGAQNGGKAAPSLELNSNNVTNDEVDEESSSLTTVLKVMSCRCKSRLCPKCGPQIGYKTRSVLLSPEKLALFKRPRLITLTIDPKKFESPEAAHKKVTTGRYIARLFRLAGVPIWAWVLELQKSGWPHWHVLIDLFHVGGWISYRRLNQIWMGWGFGVAKVSKERRRWTPEHAVNYITKYLLKAPEVPYPDWFLQGSRIRLCQGSGVVGSLTHLPQSDLPSLQFRPRKSCRKVARKAIDIVSSCNTTCVVIMSQIDKVTGIVENKYHGTLNISKMDLEVMAASGRFGEELAEKIVVVPIESKDYYATEVYIEYFTFDQLECFLFESDYLFERQKLIEERKNYLLRAHDVFLALNPGVYRKAS